MSSHCTLLALGLLLLILPLSLQEESDSAFVTRLFTDDELLNWEAPEEYKRNFTYYWSGYNEDGQPFWIGEFGKWDIRSVVEKGVESLAIFDKYAEQFTARILRSMNMTTTKENPITAVMGIIDMEDFKLHQIAHLPTMAYILKTVQRFFPVFIYSDQTYIINMNYIAERVVNILRPIIGSHFERVQVHGTNRARWISSLLKNVSPDQLPSWYGGTDPDFKPIKVYG